MIFRALLYLLMLGLASQAPAGETGWTIAVPTEIADAQPTSEVKAQEAGTHCTHHCFRCIHNLSGCGCGGAVLVAQNGIPVPGRAEHLPVTCPVPAFSSHTSPPPGKPPRTLA
ncbi:MAG TPA: hypothetical protein ENI90_02260 [Methylothermaceae bacterium]|nr:hypothetical protein [Methylothermaceae bacterium]